MWGGHSCLTSLSPRLWPGFGPQKIPTFAEQFAARVGIPNSGFFAGVALVLSAGLQPQVSIHRGLRQGKAGGDLRHPLSLVVELVNLLRLRQPNRITRRSRRRLRLRPRRRRLIRGRVRASRRRTQQHTGDRRTHKKFPFPLCSFGFRSRIPFTDSPYKLSLR
jgi:hypothetical protein